MKAMISGIKRMEIHDGDGLRTTVFFKGCPLHCIWCHNPESLAFDRQLAYFRDKCIGCNSCVSVCKEGVLKSRTPPFSVCSFCGDCVEICPTNALIAYGKEYLLKELLATVLQDRAFFENGNGGVTLSGGECLAQPEFVTAFVKQLHKKGVSVNIDTCGFVKREIFDAVLPYTDTFLYDIKAMNEDLHIRLTGKSNRLILDNLRYISEQGAKIEIRYPLVCGYNDAECESAAVFLRGLSGIARVKVLQYHSFAASRYAALGLCNTLPDTVTGDADLARAVEIFRKNGVFAVDGRVES